MNLKKISLAAVLAVFACGAYSAKANQVLDGTYVFTATDGNNFLNGSWVKFSGDSIVDWFMTDSKIDAATQQYPTTALPLNPSNSHLAANTGVIGLNAWYFTIDGNNIGVNYYDEFKGQNNLFGPGVGGGLGSLYVGFGDPDGNWTMSVDTHTRVPDATSTLPMLAGALTILGVYRARSSKK